MAIKTWNEMYKFDVSPYVQERKGGGGTFKYLPWHTCIMLLYKNGAERVSFIPLYSDNGHSIFTYQHAQAIQGEPYAPEVHVRVSIDGLDGEFSYPLISGFGVISMENVNQQDVNRVRQRAFVKGVAILTGLGLSLWEKEEAEKEKEKSYIDGLMEIYAIAMKKCESESALAKKLNMTTRTLENMMNLIKYFPEFECNLRGIK